MFTKTCPVCTESKDDSEFRKDKHSADGLVSCCKLCARKRYQQYADKNRARIREVTRARSQRTGAWITEIKRELGCKVCGEREPCCLEFHHTDDNKEFTIAQARGASKQRLLAEISKCVCLCSNCHKKVHAGVIVI